VRRGGRRGKPESELTDDERKEVATYGEAALGCLKDALAAGFADSDAIRSDPDLAAIRSLPGYAEIAKSLR
jgi:hypothetical protein